jgi:hypothetical protein
MIELSVIRDLVAIFGVIAGFSYYVMVVRNQKETRQAQLFMQLFQTYVTKEWMTDNWELMTMEWDDLKDFFDKYDSSVDIDNFAKRYRSWFFLDGIGLLLKKGLVDKEMVYHLMGGYWGIWLWEKFEDVIRFSREYNNLPELAVWFEYLAQEMAKMRVERGSTDDVPETWGAIKLTAAD